MGSVISLYQTVKYWPKGTVFVSVVDPGVGSDRRSIACLTYSVITLLHLIMVESSFEGIKKVIEIDEVKSRLPHSEESHTFSGRDVYA